MPLSLVAVDMDGTFLRPDMTYDRARFTTLRQRMRAADIRFVVASGNQYWQLESFFEAPDDVVYAAENGHFLYDLGDRTPFHQPEVRPEAARQMITALEKRRLTYLVSTAKGAYGPSWMPPEGLQWAKLYYPNLQIVEDVSSHADDVVKATMRVNNPALMAAELDEELGGAYAPVVSGPVDVDLNVPGKNKGVGLQLLAERWGIDLADAIAFGDSYNDVEMLKAVGLPVVMSNAPKDLHTLAARIAPPNSVDGVLEVLDEVLPA